MSNLIHRIIVLGPLRSGTSLTAKLVHLWGAYAGCKDELWESDPNDQRGYGYMEYIPLQELNDELLDHNDRVPPHPGRMAECASDPKYRDEALRLLDRMDAEASGNGAPAWVWKDARLPLTLPFWDKVWGDPIYVITVRHPAETILSAARTEGVEEENVPYSVGLIYWQYCILNILNSTQSSRRKIFIAYDQLTRHPDSECARLSNFLDQQCARSTKDAQQSVAAMAPQVSEGRRHYRQTGSLAEMTQATREQRALYDFLRVKTIYPDEAFNKDDFALYPGWREYLQAMDMLLTVSRMQET